MHNIADACISLLFDFRNKVYTFCFTGYPLKLFWFHLFSNVSTLEFSLTTFLQIQKFNKCEPLIAEVN